MKTTRLNITLTALSIVALAYPAQAQLYVGTGGQPTVEVNLDALDSLPQARSSRSSRHAVRLHAPRVFRDQNDEVVSYSGGDDMQMSYEQAVRLAGGTINGRVPVETMPLGFSTSRSSSSGNRKSRRSRGDTEDTSYDSVENLNRLSVECSAGNMVPRGRDPNFMTVSAPMPMAPPVTSAGSTSIPDSSRVTTTAVPPARTRATPTMSDLPATPAITSAPVPLSPAIQPTVETAAIPAPAPVPMPSVPLPPPTPVAMTPPPVPARLTPDDLKIDFSPNSEALLPDANTHLNRLVAKMTGSSELRVELRSFATGSPDMASKARRLALARALSVRSYLTGQGIDPERIDVRALGNAANATPGDRVDIFLTR